MDIPLPIYNIIHRYLYNVVLTEFKNRYGISIHLKHVKSCERVENDSNVKFNLDIRRWIFRYITNSPMGSSDWHWLPLWKLPFELRKYNSRKYEADFEDMLCCNAS